MRVHTDLDQKLQRGTSRGGNRFEVFEKYHLMKYSWWYFYLVSDFSPGVYDMFTICDGDDSSISSLSVTCAFKKSKSVSWTECLVRKYFFLFHFFSFGHFWNFYNTHSFEAWEAPVVRGKPTICHMLCTCTRTQSTLKV